MIWFLGICFLVAVWHDGKNCGKEGSRRGKSNGGGFGASGFFLIAFIIAFALGG